MRSDTFKLLLIKPGIAAGLILLASGASVAQAVNLSAGPSTTAVSEARTYSIPLPGQSLRGPYSVGFGRKQGEDVRSPWSVVRSQ